MQKNIVILGGGFGGLRVALELIKRPALLRDHRIILVDRNTHHLYTPLLYEVASAFLERATPAEDFCMRSIEEIKIDLDKQSEKVNAFHRELRGRGGGSLEEKAALRLQEAALKELIDELAEVQWRTKK